MKFKHKFIIISIFYALFFSFSSNAYSLFWENKNELFSYAVFFLSLSILGVFLVLPSRSLRTKSCYHGALLLSSFVTSSFFSAIYQIITGIIINDLKIFLFRALFCICVEAIVFWIGITFVYISSIQLGIKTRFLGIVFGLIPVLNLIMLKKIIKIVLSEAEFESDKELFNLSRKEQKICETKYPLLLVHGVFFRDFKYFNYWGRIPKELKKNGATIFYGNHQSASSVENSAKEISQRIKDIIEETGCDKVNIIAHSKGGLDCRKAIELYDVGSMIASLTTINSPHKGCQFAEHLLTIISDETKEEIADKYNRALKKLGDENPDFLAAVSDLTYSAAFEDDKEKFTNIYCQSVGSVLKKASGGKFPLNLSYRLVKRFDGANDGLVCENSFPWGEKYTLLKPSGDQGISHGDMIDLHRTNVKDFDVREFYVQLVKDLKGRGL